MHVKPCLWCWAFLWSFFLLSPSAYKSCYASRLPVSPFLFHYLNTQASFSFMKQSPTFCPCPWRQKHSTIDSADTRSKIKIPQTRLRAMPRKKKWTFSKEIVRGVSLAYIPVLPVNLGLQTLIRRKVHKKLKLPTSPKENKNTKFAPPAPAAEPGPSKLPDAAPQLATPKLLTRTNTHDSTRSKRSDKSKKLGESGLQIAPPAPALKTSIEGGDTSSEDDSDLDEFAFDHPNTYKDAPWIWIPQVTQVLC